MSLVSVRLNGKDASEAPLSCGMSVVRVTSPAALGVTRMSTRQRVGGSAGASTPRTGDPLGALGRGGRDGHVEGDLGRRVVPSVSTPSTVKPPPRRTAVQPAGAPVTVRSTRSGRVGRDRDLEVDRRARRDGDGRIWRGERDLAGGTDRGGADERRETQHRGHEAEPRATRSNGPGERHRDTSSKSGHWHRRILGVVAGLRTDRLCAPERARV